MTERSDFEAQLEAHLASVPFTRLGLPDALAAFRARDLRTVAQLAEINAPDLLLAIAALERIPTAQRELDRRLVAVCRGISLKSFDFDELVQLTRARVFVGPPPRLETYSGRGALAQWLRAVALTTLSHATRSRKEHSGMDDERVLAMVTQDTSPELRAIDKKRSRLLLEALTRALMHFSSDERTMLKLRFANGMTFDEVARVFGTHRTTAMRTVEKAHARLIRKFHDELEAAEVSRSELDSLSRLFEGSFMLHLRDALGEK